MIIALMRTDFGGGGRRKYPPLPFRVRAPPSSTVLRAALETTPFSWHRRYSECDVAAFPVYLPVASTRLSHLSLGLVEQSHGHKHHSHGVVRVSLDSFLPVHSLRGATVCLLGDDPRFRPSLPWEPVSAVFCVPPPPPPPFILFVDIMLEPSQYDAVPISCN